MKSAVVAEPFLAKNVAVNSVGAIVVRLTPESAAFHTALVCALNCYDKYRNAERRMAWCKG